MCTTFLVTIINFQRQGFWVDNFRSFLMPILAREGYHRTGMSIFLLFLCRLWIALDANSHTVLKQCVASNRYARKICENFSKCLGGGIPPGRARSCVKLLHFCKRCNACIWCLWAICPHSTYKDGDSHSCRTDNLHSSITFRNQSAGLSACFGRPLADFRSSGEQSDCFENTV